MTVQVGHIIEGALLPSSINTAGNALGSYGPFTNAGAPAGGYLNGIAAKGALCIDTTTPKLYQNSGTLAATVWTSVGSQT